MHLRFSVVIYFCRLLCCFVSVFVLYESFNLSNSIYSRRTALDAVPSVVKILRIDKKQSCWMPRQARHDEKKVAIHKVE